MYIRIHSSKATWVKSIAELRFLHWENAEWVKYTCIMYILMKISKYLPKLYIKKKKSKYFGTIISNSSVMLPPPPPSKGRQSLLLDLFCFYIKNKIHMIYITFCLPKFFSPLKWKFWIKFMLVFDMTTIIIIYLVWD